MKALSLASGIYYDWVLVVTLGITETITWGILYYGFTVFLPPMEADLGWSRGEMSGAFSVGILLSGVCAAPVGRWLDHRGPRLLMTGGSIAASLLLLAWSQVTSLVQFYVLWALIGVTMRVRRMTCWAATIPSSRPSCGCPPSRPVPCCWYRVNRRPAYHLASQRLADRVASICERVVFTVTGRMEEINTSTY